MCWGKQCCVFGAAVQPRMIGGQRDVCGCKRACTGWFAGRTQRGMTCLHWACYKGHTATAVMLVGKGADMTATYSVRRLCS